MRDNLLGQLWAEFFGTAILIILGDGVVANVVYATRLKGFGVFASWGGDMAGGAGYDWNTIAFGWGFAVVMAVYVAGGITGAHINPAVTLAAMVCRGMDLVSGLLWMVAQVAGAFFGAFLVHMQYMGDFLSPVGSQNIFCTSPAPGDSPVFTQYFSEILGTWMLLLLIYAIVDSANNLGPGANLWPFMVGMAVLSIGLSLGGPTGYAINPARDLGPRLYGFLFAGNPGDLFGYGGSTGNPAYWLVPIIGPLIGGVLGGFTYDLLVAPFLPKKE
jgi:glycerol uptake facilitator protein